MIKQDYGDGKKHIHVLSFGAGTQSSAMLLMALKGEFNGVIPDFIIFADTGWEGKETEQWLSKMQKVAESYGKEIIIASGGNIHDDVIDGYQNGYNVPSLPYYTQNPITLADPNATKAEKRGGITLRQCTMKYKIEPIQKKVRELLGYKKGQRIKEIVHMWKGISTDEIQRVKPSQVKWIVHEHPFIDLVQRNRSECIAYVERQGLGTPPKSSCIGCPFHDNGKWLEMKRNKPEEWAEAVAFDKQIRNNPHPNMKSLQYLHKQRVPLDEVVLDENQMSIFDDDFNNECEGMCGI